LIEYKEKQIMKESVIEVKDFHKVYGKFVAVDKISFDVKLTCPPNLITMALSISQSLSSVLIKSLAKERRSRKWQKTIASMGFCMAN